MRAERQMAATSVGGWMGWKSASPHLLVRQLQLRNHVDPVALVELPVGDGGEAEVLGDELEHHRRLGLDHLQAYLADLSAWGGGGTLKYSP